MPNRLEVIPPDWARFVFNHRRLLAHAGLLAYATAEQALTLAIL